jgi:hypothetical protein
MSKAAKVASIAALLCALPTVSNAIIVGTPETYTDLVWDVSTGVSGLSGCNELQIDATGDLDASTKLSIYGALNCPFQQSGSLGVVGSAYFGGDGSFNMTLVIGSSRTLRCVAWPGLSGPCTVTDMSGNPLGSASLSFL